ncbi:hypothetical protein HanIR_Chr12g0586411 [Helianthus annuus]|nr:hypothetical protein HanIR_Chr12g0586411 [Helianthus annuus]
MTDRMNSNSDSRFLDHTFRIVMVSSIQTDILMGCSATCCPENI